MPNDTLRTLRLRWDDILGPGPGNDRRAFALDNARAVGTPRFIGRVRDAGAVPTVTDRIFLTNPVMLDGIDVEAAGAPISVDESRSVPVVVVGSLAPKAGDLIIAHAAGGRWVSEFGTPPATVACDGCDVPRRDITLTWTNSVLGTHSNLMTFNGVNEWTTGCVNQIVFRLTCRLDEMTFSATYFIDGPCPTGQPATCAGSDSSHPGLTLTARSCSPFMLRYDPESCPELSAQGFTRLTVTL